MFGTYLGPVTPVSMLIIKQTQGCQSMPATDWHDHQLRALSFSFTYAITQQRGPVALDVVYVQKLPFKFQLITFSICLVKSRKNTSRSLFWFWETLAANNNIIHYYKYKVIDVLSP